MTKQTLPSAVFSKLNDETSIQKDVLTARKMAHRYLFDKLPPDKLQVIERVFRFYVDKAEVEVRQTLAELLKDSHILPHDIAMSMAKDESSEVAEPILRMSEILTDDDLIAIIRATDCVLRRCSIAQRKQVSADLSDTLIETGDQTVVEHLMFNSGAEFNEESLEKMIATFPNNVIIAASVFEHVNIPSTIVEKLIANASEKVQNELHEKYGISKYSMQPITNHTHAVTSLDLLAPDAAFGNTKLLVDHLFENSRLSPMMALTSLSTLKLRFFKLTIATHANVPYQNVGQLLQDTEAFYRLYRKAGLPMKFYDVCDLMRNIYLDMKTEGLLPVQTETYAETLQQYKSRIRKKAGSQPYDGLDIVIASIDKEIQNSDSESQIKPDGL